MHDYNLGFISNEAIYEHVRHTVESFRREIALDQFLRQLASNSESGWKMNDADFDLKNDNRHIYAIFTDRYRSINSPSTRIAYLKMQSRLLEDKQAECYLVVLNTKSENRKWEITINRQPIAHNRIRRISIDKFCELAFNSFQL